MGQTLIRFKDDRHARGAVWPPKTHRSPSRPLEGGVRNPSPRLRGEEFTTVPV